jgi:hypothetical protein
MAFPSEGSRKPGRGCCEIGCTELAFSTEGSGISGWVTSAPGRTELLIKVKVSRMRLEERMGRPSRMIGSLRAAVEQRVSRDFASDIFEPEEPLTPEEELEQRRSELRNGLTDMQRLFLFGKLGGLNDKDAAIAAGYSVSVAENTKQRIWKPRVRAEFERLQRS